MAGSPLPDRARILVRAARFAGLAAFCALAGLQPALAQDAGAGVAPAHRWLAETVCAHAGGRLTPGALTPGCSGERLRGVADLPLFERHDWPAAHEARQRPFGYQRSTSYLVARDDGSVEAVQTFDFGGGERGFGRFDGGRGDGGQVAALRGPAAVITMTEDGTGGVQWFTGSACRGRPEPSRAGWVLFAGEPQPGWSSLVAELRITRSPDECPARFDRSYTRWRLLPVDWPILFDGASDPSRPTLPSRETLVSEHFGGASLDAANHLERFYLLRGVGLARWERWEQTERSRRPNLEERAARLAASGRCPDIAGGEPPAQGWVRVDCRHWMNFVAVAADGAGDRSAVLAAPTPGRSADRPANARGFAWGRTMPQQEQSR